MRYLLGLVGLAARSRSLEGFLGSWYWYWYCLDCLVVKSLLKLYCALAISPYLALHGKLRGPLDWHLDPLLLKSGYL